MHAMLRLFAIIVFSFSILSLSAQEQVAPCAAGDSLVVKTSFAINEDSLSAGMHSSRARTRIVELLDEGAHIRSINVAGYSSVDGPEKANLSLSLRRARFVAQQLQNIPGLKDVAVEYEGKGEDWESLPALVEKSNCPKRYTVLAVIRSQSSRYWKEQRLKSIDGGNVWKYLTQHILPEQRCCQVTLVWVNKTGSVIEETLRDKSDQPCQVKERYPEKAEPELPVESGPVVLIPEPKVESQAQVQDGPLQPQTPAAGISEQVRLIRIKNNLVLSGALIFNVAVEVSLNGRFSINMPLAWSPYTIGRNWRLRTFALMPEFRWWLKEGWTGHFLGAQAHMAFFNISTVANRKERYQDRDGRHPLVGVGVNYGYAMPLSRDGAWGVEFMLGVGYAYLDWDVFYNIDNGAKHGAGTRHYFGLTQAGVNFSYRFLKRSTTKRK